MITTPQIKIVNVETGEEIMRDASDQEIAQMEKDKIDHETRNAEFEAAKTKAEADKAALLARLGLTAEEAALLLS